MMALTTRSSRHGSKQTVGRPPDDRCPLIAGRPGDHAQLITGAPRLCFEAVSCPVLLAPFASRLASSRGEAVALSWRVAIFT